MSPLLLSVEGGCVGFIPHFVRLKGSVCFSFYLHIVYFPEAEFLLLSGSTEAVIRAGALTGLLLWSQRLGTPQ